MDLGQGLWIIKKMDQVKDSWDLWQSGQGDGIDFATKLAELGAGAASGFATSLWIKGIQKTGLDRVFDSLRRDRTLADYVASQNMTRSVADFAAGEATDALIDWLRDYAREHGTLDPIFDFFHIVTNTTYRNGLAPPRPRDPLAIDLDGDGIETVGVGSTPVLFDHNADGIRTGTGWVKADDAWLVLDRNGNGTIDSGRELFGVDTVINTIGDAYDANAQVQMASSGFEALGVLDSNADGAFNASDAEFVNVRLWQDLNQDGVSQSGELFTLAQKGIASIGLTPTTGTTNLGNGNTVTGQATVTRTNGTTTQVDSVSVTTDSTAANLDLANNPFYREFTDAIPLTDTARALPEMNGSGVVRDLREAMSIGNAQGTALVNAL